MLHVDENHGKASFCNQAHCQVDSFDTADKAIVGSWAEYFGPAGWCRQSVASAAMLLVSFAEI